MSLVPLLFSDWWEDLDRPHSLVGQNFGLPLDPEDLIDRIAPTQSELVVYKPNKLRQRLSRYHPFLHNLARRGHKSNSTVSAEKDKFRVTLDVQQFHPEEISVKVVDDNIVVEAKHEEKEDEHGWISRQFTRKYLVPSQCDVEHVESHLSSDGVLTITAPRKQPQKLDSNEKVIKIQFTGEPAITQQDASAAGSSQAKEQNQQRQAQAAQRGKKSTVKAA